MKKAGTGTPFRLFVCLTVGVCLAVVASLAAASPDEAVPKIDAVWDVYVQPCNGAHAHGFQPDPHKDEIRQSGVVELPSLRLRFRVPTLPDMRQMSIQLYLGDKSRGVVDNYLLIAENDLTPPVAAVVVTELPKDFDGRKALAAVTMLERGLAGRLPAPPVLDKIAGPYGEGLEMLVPERVGTQCFPTAGFQLVPPETGLSSMGISRFVFTRGYLVEFALIVRTDPAQVLAERKAYARSVMDRFWSGLGPM